MFQARVWVPWALKLVWSDVTWFAWVHWAFSGLIWMRNRTCWAALGSVTSAEKEIWLFVHPSNWVVSAFDWRAVSVRLPACATFAGSLGGRPKSGGVKRSSD